MIFDTKSTFRRDRMAARMKDRLARDHSATPTGLPPRRITPRDIIHGVLLVAGLAIFLFLPIVYLAFG